MLYTLDASAWVRLFTGDGPVAPSLERALLEVDRGQASLVAPELILVEAAHALGRKRQLGILSTDEEARLWRDMRALPLDLLPAAEHIEAARELASAHGVSVYDALYLAVSEHTGAPLLTADDELLRLAVKLGIGA